MQADRGMLEESSAMQRLGKFVPRTAWVQCVQRAQPWTQKTVRETGHPDRQSPRLVKFIGRNKEEEKLQLGYVTL